MAMPMFLLKHAIQTKKLQAADSVHGRAFGRPPISKSVKRVGKQAAALKAVEGN